jgi:glycosyltransferase involved in cell wall biosynthesis
VSATAPSLPRPSVLHVSAAEGGGVDRYIRDVAKGVQRRHFLWHTGAGIDVIEDLSVQQFLPLSRAIEGSAAAAPLAEWSRSNAIGIVHLHSLGKRCRDRLSRLQSVRVTPWIVTLHDVAFIDPRAFDGYMHEPDVAWIAEISDTLARAASVIAPSAYIRGLAQRHFPGLQPELIQPGIGTPRNDPVSVRAEFAAHRLQHVVAVVGAIGPHKGSGLLDALGNALLETGIGVVVIGYLDSQLSPGWRVPGRCYVHGPYVDAELHGLMASYGVDAALFPNRLPESFSYTLSEVWAAGIPVIVPAQGALGERVSQHGGGWLLPEGFSAEEAAQLLRRLFAPAGAVERARVKSQIDPRDPARIPTLASMARDIDAIYERFGLKPPSPDNDLAISAEALRPLLAANLDGFAFRRELTKLTREAVQLRTTLEEARLWAAKLEHDVAVLTAEGKKLFEENRHLLDAKAAFEQLPLSVRKLLLKKAFRARR